MSKPAWKRAKPAAEPPSASTIEDLLLNETMIRIPAGPFRRNGTHTVTLPLFWIAKFPVTNKGYALFVSMTGRQPPRGWDGVEPPPELLVGNAREWTADLDNGLVTFGAAAS